MVRRTYDSFGKLEKQKDKEKVTWRQVGGNGNHVNEDDDLIDIEAIDETTPFTSQEEQQNDLDEKTEIVHPIFLFGFLLISFGYMLPWTALGSLISYFKYTYSARFYVMMYCGYYLPGLPVSIAQYVCNEKVDRFYGSQTAFFLRGVFGFTVLVFVLFALLWIDDQTALVILFAILGVGSWWLHGTASMLASLFPKKAIAYLQIGFRCPEIYSVLAVYFLDLGKDATDAHLAIFYKLTAIVVLLCFGVWVMVTSSSVATRYFQEKDYRIRTGLSRVTLVPPPSSLTRGHSNTLADMEFDEDTNESYSLLGRQHGYQDISHSSPHTNTNNNFNSSRTTHTHTSDEHDTETFDEWTVIRPTKGNLSSLSSNNAPPSLTVPSSASSLSPASHSPVNSHQQITTTTVITSPNMSPIPIPASSPIVIQTADTASQKAQRGDTSGNLGKKGWSGMCMSAVHIVCYYACRLPAQGLGKAIKFMFYFLYKDDPIFLAVCPVCVALMITMWSSIFQASFFAYVNSKRGWNIEQILYFTRLFSDLLGRPLTFLPRPSFIQTPDQLLEVAMIRGFLLIVFFLYTFLPSFPQSDWFIIAFVAAYSLSSGYIAVLCYEYAASETMSRAQRAHAASILNMSFQIAAFLAVLLSVSVTSGSWLEEQR